MKISPRVSELLCGHEIITERLTDRQTDRQGDYFRASADFVWRGPNDCKSCIKGNWTSAEFLQY